MKIVMSAVALAGLVACGGSGSTDMTPTKPSTVSTPTFGQLETSVRGVEADQLRIANLTPTTTRNIPTSGTSTFTGGALLAVRRGQAEYNLVGDSALSVNFANGRMIGRANNFKGANSRGETFNAAGQLNYSGGQVGLGASPNVFVVNFDGNLAAGADTIGVNGVALGAFSGNRVNGSIRTKAVQGIAGTPGSLTVGQGIPPGMTATVNGQTAIGDFGFVGEN